MPRLYTQHSCLLLQHLLRAPLWPCCPGGMGMGYSCSCNKQLHQYCLTVPRAHGITACYLTRLQLRFPCDYRRIGVTCDAHLEIGRVQGRGPAWLCQQLQKATESGATTIQWHSQQTSAEYEFNRNLSKRSRLRLLLIGVQAGLRPSLSSRPIRDLTIVLSSGGVPRDT
jgi:hypothetical protein